RLRFALGPEVPNGVDDGAGGHVQDALLRTEPAKLLVDGQLAKEAAQVGGDVVKTPADDVVLEGVDGRHADLVAAAVGERQPVAGEAGVGQQRHVGRRVVAEVQRIRAVQLLRGGEANVADAELCDLHRALIY